MSARVPVESIIEKIKTVFDPEIPVNIYDLGLIYEIEVDPVNNVSIKMTLTSPACPVAGSLPGEIADKVKTLDDVQEVKMELVWEPSWNQYMMSEEAQFELGMM